MDRFPIFVCRQKVLFTNPTGIRVDLAILFQGGRVARLCVCNDIQFAVRRFDPFYRFLSAVNYCVPVRCVFVRVERVMPILSAGFRILPIGWDNLCVLVRFLRFRRVQV